MPRRHEKQPVPAVEYFRNPHRTAHFGAKLIALQDVFRNVLLVVEERIGIEVVIANVVEEDAVKVVSSALGDHADDSGAVPSVFGVVVAGQNAELFHRVGIRDWRHSRY